MISNSTNSLGHVRPRSSNLRWLARLRPTAWTGPSTSIAGRFAATWRNWLTHQGTAAFLPQFGAVAQTGCALGAVLLVHFCAMRCVLLACHGHLGFDALWRDLLRAFWIGMQFDLATIAYSGLVLLPAFWICERLGGRRLLHRAALALGAILLAALTLLGVAELEFYGEFYVRYNSLALSYWQQPSTVLSMIWHGYPVMGYLCLVLLLTALQWFCLRWLLSKATVAPAIARASVLRPAAGLALLGVVLVVLARGGFRGTPLNWGDAIHCQSAFANHLAQNGIWNLGNTVKQLVKKEGTAFQLWQHPLPADQAQAALGELLAPDQLKESSGQTGSGPPSLDEPGPLHLDPAAPPNVVVIIMESFSARFCGACGAGRSGDDYTPEFNRLAAEGVLFDRCLSAGTHTHQANYATVCGVPNLPGHECLMNDATLGAQTLDSLPRALKQRGYQTWYLYNGDLAWENMRGFFRVQGIDRFVDRSNFGAESQFDSTWGVTDEELFRRAHREFSRCQTPFCATLCTLSNHEPFDLPRPLPFREVSDQGSMNRRLNGIRYADWALGQFFALARQAPYFNNTLFVLVGDHGFSVAPILTDLRLLRFHVPLLFYAPRLMPDGGRVEHRLASQLDIVPTVLRLLHDRAPHCCWGKNLFAPTSDDAGWAYFKPTELGAQVGLARGDRLLVKLATGQSKLYQFDLGFPASVRLVQEPQTLRSLDFQLQAYVETATRALEGQQMLSGPSQRP